MSIHNLPTADALRTAARESIKTAPDPQSGTRPGDPLRELIPGEHTAPRDVLALMQIITGRRIVPGPHVAAAAAARAVSIAHGIAALAALTEGAEK